MQLTRVHAGADELAGEFRMRPYRRDAGAALAASSCRVTRRLSGSSSRALRLGAGTRGSCMPTVSQVAVSKIAGIFYEIVPFSS